MAKTGDILRDIPRSLRRFPHSARLWPTPGGCCQSALTLLHSRGSDCYTPTTKQREMVSRKEEEVPSCCQISEFSLASAAHLAEVFSQFSWKSGKSQRVVSATIFAMATTFQCSRSIVQRLNFRLFCFDFCDSPLTLHVLRA